MVRHVDLVWLVAQDFEDVDLGWPVGGHGQEPKRRPIAFAGGDLGPNLGIAVCHGKFPIGGDDA